MNYSRQAELWFCCVSRIYCTYQHCQSLHSKQVLFLISVPFSMSVFVTYLNRSDLYYTLLLFHCFFFHSYCFCVFFPSRFQFPQNVTSSALRNRYYFVIHIKFIVFTFLLLPATSDSHVVTGNTQRFRIPYGIYDGMPDASDNEFFSYSKL